jgi:hypothetical protein
MVASRNTVHDFMRRTKANLGVIENGALNEPHRFFEVTQLINSVIGLLMFPSEELLNKLPGKKLSEVGHEVELPKLLYGTYRGEEDPDVRTAIRYLRNGFAHYNIQFVNTNNVIQGLYVWNRPQPRGKPDWIAYVSIKALRGLFEEFCGIFEKISRNEAEAGPLDDKIAALEKELEDELCGRAIRLINPESLR